VLALRSDSCDDHVVLVIRSDVHAAHHCLELDGAELIQSWESPARAEHVDVAISAAENFVLEEPDPFDRSAAEAVHHPEYVDFLSTAWRRWTAEGHRAPSAMAFGWPARRFRDVRPRNLEAQLGYYSFAADCSIGAGTWPAVADSAAIAQTAADRVVGGERAVFARCRPPGHHAMKDQFGGYCYLNNAAIAAQRMRNAGVGRVAVLDVDYHHGNGTQDIFYDRSDVSVCSIHADPFEEFPYFLGHDDEVGADAGAGHNLNLPLPRGTDARTWFATLEHAGAWVESQRPDALVVSLGLDTFVDDPISHFQLRRVDFATLGVRLAGFGIPTVLVMEGGYATEELGHNMVAVLAAFDAAG
jgi:acetoin utilization deacetylase AcuC-like enzyme